VKYASFLAISHALLLYVFDQPVKNHFFNNLIGLVFDPEAQTRRELVAERLNGEESVPDS
jgi:hypothetical protein